MDFRTYLALEIALSRRLVASWKRVATPVYEKIDHAIASEDWTAALEQVQHLDLTHVGEENKEYIKHVLLSCAMFGAKMANRKGPQFLSAGTHDELLDRVTGVMLQFFEHTATAHVQAEVLQLIAEAENNAKQKFFGPALKYNHNHDEKGRFASSDGGGGYDPTKWDSEVPPAPGTAPIPEGNVRLYHQTDIKNLDSIAKNGITLDHARGIEGPSAIYADEKGFYGNPEDTPTVEFSVPKDQWDAPFVLRDVTPKDIVAIHAPWHRKARYLTRPGNDKALHQALSGEFDDLTGDYAKAVQYVKAKYGKAQKFADYVLKFNPNHVPAGSPDGGQFTSANGVSNGQEGTAQAAADGAGRGVGTQGAREGGPEDSQTISGVHYSSQARETLEGSKFGSGADSQEAQRVKYAEDPRIRNRIYAYIDEGSGIKPESGVGGVAHNVTFSRMYDMRKDPAGLFKQAVLAHPYSPDDRANAFESSILDAGYHGYFLSGAQGSQGVAILLGDSTKGFKPDKVSKGDWSRILKFNPYHDERGRFTTADGAGGSQVGGDGRTRFDGLRLADEGKSEQVDAADTLLAADYKAWAKSLTRAEGRAVDSYVGSDFRPMNAMLRGQPVTASLIPALKEGVSNLASALDKTPTVKEDFYTYRGCSEPVTSMLAAGSVLKDEGFVSTSLSPLVASRFSEEGGPATLLRIHVPAGAKGAYVSTKADWMHEGEFLLPAGSQFKIVKGPVIHKIGEVPFDGPFTIGQEAHIYDAELVLSPATSKADSPPKPKHRQADKFTWGEGDLVVVSQKDDMVSADLNQGGKLNPQLLVPRFKRRRRIKADDNGRYVMPFVSFADPGQSMVQLISSLNSSRLATWGFTMEADHVGVTTYKLAAVLDGRTSAFCRMIDGMVFQVQDAKRLVNEALSAQNPDDLKVIQPWPRQDKASIAEYSQMTAQDLTDLGLNIPPFHPNCRTMCVMLDDSVGEQPPALAGGENRGALDSIQATKEVFQSLGVDITDAQLQHWNDYLELDPGALLAMMFGTLESLNLAQPPIDFQSNGNILFNMVLDFAGGAFTASTAFDPYSATVYLEAADFSTNALAVEDKVLGTTFSGVAAAGMSMGATTMVVDAGGSGYDYVKMGFLPKSDVWQSIRMDALDALTNGNLKDAFASLDADQQATVTSLLSDSDEHALQVLVDLGWEIDGTPLAQMILDGVDGQFYLDLMDDDQVARAKEYF